MPNPRRQSRRRRRGREPSPVPVAGQLDSWAGFADRSQPRAVTQDRPPAGSRRAPSPGILPPPLFEKLVADLAAVASARTLKELDVSSSKELFDTTSSEESITANPQTVPHSTTDSSPLSASSLGPKISLRCPPNWYQVYYIRMDRSGCFWMYPDLGGPFQSLDEADGAINSHLKKLRHQAMFDEQARTSVVDRLVYEHNHYLDGTAKRGPNSRRRKSTIIHQHYLVEALVNQYNDVHNLLGNLAHELESLVSYTWIYEDNRSYYHFNFTTKTKEADSSPGSCNLFFAELSRMRGECAWEVNFCSMIDFDNDNGHCYGCRNNGSPGLKHPNDTTAYTGGHLDGYLPYGDDEFSRPDDEETEEARVRALFKGFDDPHYLEGIHLRSMQRHSQDFA